MNLFYSSVLDELSALKASQISFPTFYTREYTNQFKSFTLYQDFLPDHSISLFANKVEVRYVGDWSSGKETFKVNGKELPVGLEPSKFGAGTYQVLVKIDADSLGLHLEFYIEGQLQCTTDLTDSFVLSLEIKTAASCSWVDSIQARYTTYKYKEVSLNYLYPVLETVSGEVIYCTSPAVSCMGDIYDIHACYTLGSSLSGLAIPTAPLAVKQELGHVQGCKYVYMANWKWLSQVKSVLRLFQIYGDSDQYQVPSPIRQLDFSLINFSNCTSLVRLFYNLNLPFLFQDLYFVLASDLDNRHFCIQDKEITFLGARLSLLDITKFNAFHIHCPSLRWLPDLSGWDISSLNVSGMFKDCYSLSYAGDLANWGSHHFTGNLDHLFSGCFSLQGISDNISSWRFPEATSLAFLFESAMCVGDSVLRNLGCWDVSSVKDLRGIFSYNYEVEYKGAGAACQYFAERNIDYPCIQDKRTDLSFVENWDVSSCVKFQAMFANNPYLKTVGKLSNWEISPKIALAGVEGMMDFLLNCSSLEDLDMPVVPFDTNMTNFVKGCSSLKNVTCKQLNVAEISFEDCPLTKQSVLNLVNASTVSVQIKVSSETFSLLENDGELQSAITEKARKMIRVRLVSV